MITGTEQASSEVPSAQETRAFKGKLPPTPTTRVWSRPQRLGYTAMAQSLGGVVAPLLVGFSLATIALLLTSSLTPRLSDWSVAAFVACVVCLLFSMQVGSLVLAYGVSPDQRMAWYPEARRSKEALDHSRLEHELDQQLVAHYWWLHSASYDLGLLSFLTGVLLLLLPSEWTAAKTLGFAIASVGLAIELRWIGGMWLIEIPRLPSSWRDRFQWKRVTRPSDEAVEPLELTELDTVSSSAILDE